MNLSRKNIGRVATTFLATAMLAGLTAVPAFAANGIQGSTDTTIDHLEITKKLEMPVNVVTSEPVDFTFTLEGTTANPGETILSSGDSLDVSNGVGKASATAHFDAGAENGDTQTVTFNFSGTGVQTPFTFTDPGVYKYTIDEDAVDTADGYEDVTGTLYAYLFVRDTNGATDGGLAVYAAVVTTDGTNANKETGSTKTETWTNSYMANATGSLKVTKEIAGDMASPNDEFSFTISGLTANRTYVVTSTNDSNAATVTASAEGTATFKLKDGEEWVIKGLEARTYTVTEDSNTEGYELTSMTNDNDTQTAGAQIVVTTGEASTEFTNTRNAVSPTGIVMNVAPYALLVVIAAAGCFVFLRKRGED